MKLILYSYYSESNIFTNFEYLDFLYPLDYTDIT